MNLLRLNTVLAEKGISKKELAEKMGVSQNTISNISGGHNFPKPELLLNIAEYLNVDIRELFNSTTGKTLLNGFVEYEGKVHRIKSKEDLERLIILIKN